MPTARALTAIVIPVHEMLPLVQGCVALIERHTPKDTYRLILVDDHSSSVAADALKRLAGSIPDRKYLSMESFAPARAGFTQTLNAGIREALADPEVDSVLLIESDSAVTTGWLERLRQGLFEPVPDEDDAFALAELFDFIDLNADGLLDAPELARGAFLGQSAKNVSVGQLKARAIPRLDLDANERLSWTEVCPAAPPLASLLEIPSNPSQASGTATVASCFASARGGDARRAAHARALHAVGLTRRPVGAIGPLSNSAGAQSLPCVHAADACAQKRTPIAGSAATIETRPGVTSNRLPAGWRPENAARAAWLAAPQSPGRHQVVSPLAGALDDFLVLVRRDVLERVGALSPAHSQLRYADDYSVRIRGAG